MKSVIEYVPEQRLSELAPEALVTWSFKKKLRSLRLPGSKFCKLAFTSPENLAQLQDVGAKLGLDDWHPSNWGSLFHDAFNRQPPMTYSMKLHAPQSVIGAWEEARHIGGGFVNVKSYDLISAYGWAGFRSLPVCRSARPVRRFEGAGLYLCKVSRLGRAIVPPHLRPDFRNSDRLFWVTSEEIEELDLHVDVVRGLTFAKWWEPRERLEAIMNVAPKPIWKKIFQRYWGTWASGNSTNCHATKTDKRWSIPNIFFDPVAAHYIISRVRNRIAQEAGHALYIYVDEVVTPQSLPVGEGIGEWHLKNRFENLIVKRTGHYSTPDGSVNVATGVKRGPV